MAAIATGKYLLFLNNDAILLPKALHTLFEYAENTSVPSILGLPQYDMETGSLIDYGHLLDPFLNPLPNGDPQRRNVGMVIGACLWIPKQLWNTLGGFPEWFHMLAEDMYLCCNAKIQGYPVISLADSGYKHWIGKSIGGGKVKHNALSTTFNRRAYSERNKTYVMILTYPAPVFHILLPLHLILLVIEGLLLAAIKSDSRIWRDIYRFTLYDLFLHRELLLSSRHKIQQKRNISVIEFFKGFAIIPHKFTMLLRHGLPQIK